MVSGIDAPRTESRPLENENAPPPVACVQPAAGEDPRGGPPETIPDGTRRHATRAQLHAAGVQPQLGAFRQGALGGAAQDRSKPVHPRPAGHRPVVPNAPTLAAGGPAGGFHTIFMRLPLRGAQCARQRSRERKSSTRWEAKTKQGTRSPWRRRLRWRLTGTASPGWRPTAWGRPEGQAGGIRPFTVVP